MTMLESFIEGLEQVFLGNTMSQWLRAAAVFLVVFVVFMLARRSIERRQAAWAARGSSRLQLVGLLLKSTRHYVRVIVGMYFAGKILTLPPVIGRVFTIIIVLGAAVQLAIWATVALRYQVQHHYRPDTHKESGAPAPVGVLMFAGQVIIWSLAALFALDNLGINITALVAGLGVGGIAIALAIQTILGDLFASLSIAFDRPFAVGDSLRIDDVEGTVEYIGIKSTRLRSVTGEQVILSNADVLKSRVRNLGRMPERRVVQRLRIAYETPPADAGKVPDIAEQVVTAQPDTRFVSCLLVELGVYALEFELVYFVANVGNNTIGRRTDAVNRGLYEHFSNAGIRFAYPTQRLSEPLAVGAAVSGAGSGSG